MKEPECKAHAVETFSFVGQYWLGRRKIDGATLASSWTCLWTRRMADTVSWKRRRGRIKSLMSSDNYVDRIEWRFKMNQSLDQISTMALHWKAEISREEHTYSVSILFMDSYGWIGRWCTTVKSNCMSASGSLRYLSTIVCRQRSQSIEQESQPIEQENNYWDQNDSITCFVRL